MHSYVHRYIDIHIYILYMYLANIQDETSNQPTRELTTKAKYQQQTTRSVDF